MCGREDYFVIFADIEKHVCVCARIISKLGFAQSSDYSFV